MEKSYDLLFMYGFYLASVACIDLAQEPILNSKNLFLPGSGVVGGGCHTAKY